MLETIKGRVLTAQRRKGDEGFTLIELLVVIVILAILAAIVVFAVGGLSTKGQSEACKTDMKSIQTAEEAFFAKATPGGQYTDGNGLQTGGFLTEAPTLHTVTPTNLVNGLFTGYSVTPNAANNTCSTPADTYNSPN